MTTQTIAAVICLAWVLADAKAFAFSAVAPEDYIEVLSPDCERIVLIEVKDVKRKTLMIDKGIETREVSVKAIRIETLRGNDKEHEFQDARTEEIVTDIVEAKRAHHPALDRLSGPLLSPFHRPSQSKPGHRYLALFYGKGRLFFVEVPKNSEDWRKQVRKYAWDAPTTK